ncbi:MAG: trimeric intracellular cation channel family protein [Nocardioidaceae bacterium]
MAGPTLLLVLDLAGTFAFALSGALAAARSARIDVVGLITLGMITALGGGIVRDVLIDDLPPATFSDWRYLAVAAGGALAVLAFRRWLDRWSVGVAVFDAAGLSLFCVTGASKATDFGVGPVQAVILGTVTAVGGGMIRDICLRQVPAVLSSGLYAVPALIGASITVAAVGTDVYGIPAATAAAVICMVIRLLGVRYDLHVPSVPGSPQR